MVIRRPIELIECSACTVRRSPSSRFFSFTTLLAAMLAGCPTEPGLDHFDQLAVIDMIPADIAPVGNNGYVLAGTDPVAALPALTRFDVNGGIAWSSAYPVADHGEATAVVNTVDGGFAFAGFVDGQGAFLAKVTAYGVGMWSLLYGDATTRVYDLLQLVDGSYVLVGEQGTGTHGVDVYILRVDFNGQVLWSKTYSWSYIQSATASVTTNDNGLVVTGYSKSSQDSPGSIFLMKTDFFGNEVWKRHYPDIGDATAASLLETSDGGLAVVGAVSPQSSSSAMLLLRTDASGVLIFTRSFSSPNALQAAKGTAVVQLPDGGFAIAGSVETFLWWGPLLGMPSMTSDLLLVRTDVDASFQWSYLYGLLYDNEGAADVVQSPQGDLVIAAGSRLVTIDANGNSKEQAER